MLLINVFICKVKSVKMSGVIFQPYVTLFVQLCFMQSFLFSSVIAASCRFPDYALTEVKYGNVFHVLCT